MKRQSIGKKLRFQVFSRDGFTCRYCGRQSDVVTLHVDHVQPVSKGGTNDIENLITSCADCNLGKGANNIDACAPTDADRLRLHQEQKEQFAAYQATKAAMAARAEFRQLVCNLYCEIRNKQSISHRSLSCLCNLIEQHGHDNVFEWMEIAQQNIPDSPEVNWIRYIYGIRRNVLEQAKEA